MELTKQGFDNLREFVHEICGLVIPDGKEYLIRQRLEPLLREEDCGSFDDFYMKIKRDCPLRTREQIITMMTTHETSFFRDEHLFEAIQSRILPSLARLAAFRKARPNAHNHAKVRIWSAASSTGQEPYSLAMLIHEFTEANKHLDAQVRDFEILATDISVDVLEQARKGEYNRVEIGRGLPSGLRAKYFHESDGMWRIDQAIRQMVEFRQINLTHPVTGLGQFDVISCRNVLIYFDDATKAFVFEQFAQMLDDDGCMILGATESTFQMSEAFESVRYGQTLLFRKRERVAS